MQGSNYTQALKDARLRAASELMACPSSIRWPGPDHPAQAGFYALFNEELAATVDQRSRRCTVARYAVPALSCALVIPRW